MVDEITRLYRSGAGCVFNPRKHFIMECPWIRMCRERTGRPDLFLYYHPMTGNFVLANWIISKDKGLGPGYFLEVEVFKGYPEHTQSQAPSLDFIQQRCLSVNEAVRDFERKQAEAEWAEDHQLEENERHKKEVIRWLNNKGRPQFRDLAEKLQSGEIPFWTGGVETSDLIDKWNDVFAGGQ